MAHSGGRSLYAPGVDSALKAANAAGAASQLNRGATDPVRPMTVNPALSAARASGAAAAARESSAAAAKQGVTNAAPAKDPIRPLVLTPPAKAPANDAQQPPAKGPSRDDPRNKNKDPNQPPGR